MAKQNLMSKLPQSISNYEEAESYLVWLHKEGLDYHFDDGALDVFGSIFDKATCIHMDLLSEQLFEVGRIYSFDPFTIAVDLTNEVFKKGEYKNTFDYEKNEPIDK